MQEGKTPLDVAKDDATRAALRTAPVAAPAAAPAAAATVPASQPLKRQRTTAPTTTWMQWSKDEVAQWLDSEGFEHYTPCFSMVNGADLKGLTAEDLLSGLPPPAISAFVAKKMLAAIAKLST